MGEVRSFSGHFFIIWSRCEVSSPVSIRVVRVREHVVVFGRPGHILLEDGVDVVRRSGVPEEILVAKVLVHVFNHPVHASVVLRGIHILEVTAHDNNNIVSEVVGGSVFDVVNHSLGNLWCVVVH